MFEITLPVRLAERKNIPPKTPTMDVVAVNLSRLLFKVTCRKSFLYNPQILPSS